MAEIERQRIKSIYSEIKGAHLGLPTQGYIPNRAAKNFNRLLDELAMATRTPFESYKLVPSEYDTYDEDEARMSMSSVLSRLESDYGFGEANQSSTNPIVVTVNQNQQMQVTIQSIVQLIKDQENEEVRELLRQLEDATAKKDKNRSRDILATLADKSWEAFLKVLPYILEHWGRGHS